jgi:hypothetical protein
VIDKELQAVHPNAPWMWQKDWIEGRIHCHSGSVTILSWVMALLWNGFMWPMLFILWGDPDKSAMAKVIALFCAVGLGLLVWAIRNTLGWFRFGTSFFELTSNPGVIGGALEGYVHTRLKKRPEAPTQITLRCARLITTRERRPRGTATTASESATNRTTTRAETLWLAGRKIAPGQIVQGARGLAIPINIQIPTDLESTDSSNPDDQITWTLGVSCDLPGVDFETAFSVPVFVTDESRPDLTQEVVDEAAEEAGLLSQPQDRGASWVPPVVVRWTARGGVEYTFRPATSLKTAVGVSLLTVAVCIGSAVLWVWLEEAGPFALIPAVLGVLLLLATAVVWTFKSRVLIEHGMVSVRKSLLGIPRNWKVPFSDVKAVRVQREIVEGLDEKDMDWQIIVERYSEEGEVVLGGTFANRAEAVRVADEMEKLIL